MLRAFRFLATIVSFALVTGVARADLPAIPADPQIAAILARVSADGMRANDERLVGFGTRSTFSENAGPRRGVVAAREFILAQFRAIAQTSGGRMTVALDQYVQQLNGTTVPRPVPIVSVVATLKGDDPGGRTYVMSSHYDSRNSDNADGVHDAPGADDNGSGTVAVLEAARVLATVPLHATIMFATYDAEEQGLFGSAHHADALKAAGVDVEGDLNNDIIGAPVGDDGVARGEQLRIFSEALPAGADARRINLVGSENDSSSRELARFAKETSDVYVPSIVGDLIYRADRVLRGGDHESFNAAGFAAIRFVEPVETFAHQHQNVRVEGKTQYGDLLQYVDFDYLAEVTKYNVATLAALALGPARPANTQMLTKALTNSTTLQWTAVPGAVSYEIVRRATTDSLWTDVTNVGNVTTATVDFSKDSWLFGVRAVDAAGHRSVASFPAPLR